MNLKKIKKLMAKGRLKAIIKDFPGGRRMLIGVERNNKGASRKGREAYIFARPVDMKELQDKQPDDNLPAPETNLPAPGPTS